MAKVDRRAAEDVKAGARSTPAESDAWLRTKRKAGELLGGVGEYVVDKLIRDGRLHAVRVGRRELVTEASLRAFVEGAHDAR